MRHLFLLIPFFFSLLSAEVSIFLSLKNAFLSDSILKILRVFPSSPIYIIGDIELAGSERVEEILQLQKVHPTIRLKMDTGSILGQFYCLLHKEVPLNHNVLIVGDYQEFTYDLLFHVKFSAHEELTVLLSEFKKIRSSQLRSDFFNRVKSVYAPAHLLKSIPLIAFLKKGKTGPYASPWLISQFLQTGLVPKMKIVGEIDNQIAEHEISCTKYTKKIFAPYKVALNGPRQLVDIIIFSKNRPMQLDALLDSIFSLMKGFGKITVLYAATTDSYAHAYDTLKLRYPSVHFTQQDVQQRGNDFYQKCMNALIDNPSEYFMFAVDDMVMKDETDVSHAVWWMEQTGAYVVSLRLGLHTHYCYTEQRMMPMPPIVDLNEICAWQLNGGTQRREFWWVRGDWEYPNSVDMHIYRKKDIVRMLSHLNFSNPSDCEVAFASLVDMRNIGLFYPRSKAVNIPMNVVQQQRQNFNMGINTDQLLEKFNEGYRLDWRAIYGIENNSPHMPISLPLILPFEGAS